MDEGGSQVESRIIVPVHKFRRLRGSRRACWRIRSPGDCHAGLYICCASGIRAAFVPAVLHILDAYVPRITRRPIRAAYIALFYATAAAANFPRVTVCTAGTADTTSRLALTRVATDKGSRTSPISAAVVARGLLAVAIGIITTEAGRRTTVPICEAVRFTAS